MSKKAKSEEAKWYVVHTYSGHENKVKMNIEKIVENRGMQDVILEVRVPTEEKIEYKDGQKKVKESKLFPGYALVKMHMTDDSWYLVRNIRGVTSFVGPSSKPIPLTDEEIKSVGVEEPRVEVDIKVGESVKVVSGPFETFMGTVEDINVEKQTVKVLISMFGRETPIELEFHQIEKI